MNILPQALLDIMVSPFPSMVFHLALFFIFLLAILLIRPIQKVRQPIFTQSILQGLYLLLSCQVILALLHGLNWQNLLPSGHILPPLDRGVTALAYVWIIWMWASSRISGTADKILIALNIGILVLLGFSIYAWGLVAPNQNFNFSSWDWIWQIFIITALLTGMLLIPLNKRRFWLYGLLIILSNLVGHMGYLMIGNRSADYSSIVRIGQLFSFPLIILLASRLQDKKARSTRYGGIYPSGYQPSLQPVTDPAALNGWIKVAASSRIEDILPLLSESIAHTMQADVCLLAKLTLPEDENLLIEGFDRFQQRLIPGRKIKKGYIPTISGVFQRGEPLYLSAAGALPADAFIFPEILGFDQSGDMLVSPVIVNKQLWGSIVVLSPYTLRYWNAGEQYFFHTIVRKAGEIFERLALKEFIAPVVNQLPPGTPVLEPGANEASMNASLILALAEIDRLKNELNQSNEKLVIYELDSQIAEGPGGTDQSNDWQSEIDGWINVDSDESLASNPLPNPEINRILSRGIDELSGEIAGRNLTLLVNLAESPLVAAGEEQPINLMLNRLLQNIFKLTPQDGVISISTQPTELEGQSGAAIEMSSHFPESETGDNSRPDKDLVSTGQADEHTQSFLDEINEMAVNLNINFLCESIPGSSTTYKLALPVKPQAG